MKVIMYMAMSADGFVAKRDGSTPWSDEEWGCYLEVAKEVKNMIVGRRTYEIMSKNGDFEDIGDLFTVVLSRDVKNKSGAVFVESPSEALDIMSKKGFDKAFIAGGTELNSSFAKEGLVDEIYLDVEPWSFARGVKVFSDDVPEMEFELIGTKRYSDNGIQLHYRIVK